MAKKKTSKGQFESEDVRETLRVLLGVLYSENEQLYAAAQSVGVSKERARQAHKYGKSLEVMLALVFSYFGMSAKDIPGHIPKLRKMFSQPGKLTVVEELIEEVRRRISENEFVAELRTIIARDEIRSELGLKKKTSLRSAKKK